MIRPWLSSSRYDDFVYAHLGMFNTSHGVAASLPWHRWYIQQYEDALRNECGYDGTLAYWDWTLDAGNATKSPLWSNESGFGGNGSSVEHCLEDGPLALMRPKYPEPHCLRRNFQFDIQAAHFTTPVIEDLISSAKTYHEFRRGLESGPHKWIHLGIGGEMPTPGSTNDPIFFLHHAQIDRLWWKWQHRKPNGRLRDYDAMEEDLKNNSKSESSDSGASGVSLNDPLKLYGIGEDIKVEDVMSTETPLLCYKYPTA
ncbi:hypothetical protein BHYA_0306g00070 [Botrytis hyacinthi]|uniref:Tyrosinase copper-binding domain-containing protein n=1 Tax=Botrytis hyacinthi TaxID=278943 RepID=A0A4Z1G6H5_9HELO|nr:hypothetical protein BHYA_0306g00070 [Botrytis hyacinthi]